MQEYGDPAEDGKSLRPDRPEHPLQRLGAGLGDLSFKPRRNFAEAKIEFLEPEIKILPG